MKNIKRHLKNYYYDGVVHTIFRALFGLPKPKSLPMRFFSKEGDYTWDDWKEENKKKYPVRYFLSETFTLWWRVHVSMRLDDMLYWFKSHTYKTYHKLDLRQPETRTIDDYSWGWIDEDRQILFACFNVLIAHWKATGEKTIEALEKEIAKDDPDSKAQFEHQLNYMLEVKALYEYWTIYRKEKDREHARLAKEWHDIRKTRKDDKESFARVTKSRNDFENEEDEMLIRLMKIRRYMWT